jgi:phenylpropionate dioxygenase-like ring-hydroxylating dioxygenase large terminal subunit
MTDATLEPFVYNAWYVASWSEQLPSGGLLSRTILNQPVVLFRDADGTVGALEDRCCHRGAPLSWGKVQPQGLECGYHGLIFDAAGKCVVIPGQDSIPPQAFVKSYPIVERQKFIWIWMGDPARADASKIVDWAIHDDPEHWPHCKDVLHIKANYMMMIDNLMDLTHLGYIHGKTIGGNPKTHVEAEQTTEATPTGARFVRWMMNSVPPPTYVKSVGFKGRIDRWQDFEYVAPGAVLQLTGGFDVGKGARENQNQPGFHLRLFHGITPETERTCHYFWSTAIGHRQDDPEAIKLTYNEIYPTFLEDQAILEVQQQRVDLDPDRPLLTMKSDRALTYARQAIRRMIEAEQAELPRAAAE